MNLHLLRIFVKVVDAQSFSRAAEALDITQPAVSKAVRELEAQLETVLLDRRGKSFRPTESGQALYDYGRSILALEREATETLRAYSSLDRGRLTIGASTTIATYWMPSFLVDFHARHPRLELQLVAGNTRQIADLLLDCRVDVALVEGEVDDTRLQRRIWRREEMVIVAPRDLDLSSGDRFRPADLAQHTWIVRERGSGSRTATDRVLDELGLTPAHTMEVGSNEAIVQSVAAGGGLGLVPRICARDQLALGRVRRLHPGGAAIQRTLYRIRLPERPLGPAALAFEALIANAQAITEDVTP
jgi:DNA-binding transcriptional LysR family regulator